MSNCIDRAKYRGKCARTGSWLEGSLISNDEGMAYIVDSSVSYPGFFEGLGRDVLGWVDPKTVGQFTGLKDKNVFEGDIFNDHGGNIWVIKWDNFQCCFMAEIQDGGFECLDLDGLEWMNVILGNIHDNPKLLKASK